MKESILWLVMACFIISGVAAQPLDDFVERKIIKERKILAHQPIREADIFWEKRIWRVIDVREKMNQTFTWPEDPFFKILQKAALNNDITVYSAENDKFTHPMDAAEVRSLFYHVDTIEIFDPVTYLSTIKIIEDEMNWEDVKRFRIKEAWYFDKNTGTMNVRILGIAPIVDVTDENGNFRFEKPLFWAHYPELRPILSQHEVFNPLNDAALITWDDMMEMRFFASTIYKKSNINDLRLKEYYSGVDMLLEAEKVKQEIFNFEHDLWSY